MAYVEKRGKNSFRLVVELGAKANGKRIRQTKTIHTTSKRLAEKELAKFVTEIEAGEYIAPEKMTFRAFVDEWKDKYAIKQLSPQTYQTYLQYLNNRILPVFGDLRLDQIKPIHIVNFINDLGNEGIRKDKKEGGLSSGTIGYYHRILRNIFKRAT